MQKHLGIMIKIEDFENTKKQFDSILDHSSGDKLHMIIITDSVSLTNVTRFFRDILSRQTSQRVLIKVCSDNIMRLSVKN